MRVRGDRPVQPDCPLAFDISQVLIGFSQGPFSVGHPGQVATCLLFISIRGKIRGRIRVRRRLVRGRFYPPKLKCRTCPTLVRRTTLPRSEANRDLQEDVGESNVCRSVQNVKKACRCACFLLLIRLSFLAEERAHVVNRASACVRKIILTLVEQVECENHFLLASHAAPTSAHAVDLSDLPPILQNSRT